MATRLTSRLKEGLAKLYKAPQPSVPTIIWHQSHAEATSLIKEKEELMLIAASLATLSEPERNGKLRDLEKRMRYLRWGMEELTLKSDPVGEQARINLGRLCELRHEMARGQVSNRVIVTGPTDSVG